MAAPANLVNLEKVTKSYGVRPLLDEVSLGVGDGRADRRRRPQRRRQDHPAQADRPAASSPTPAGSRRNRRPAPRLPRPGRRPRPDSTPCARSCSAGRADHEWAADAAHPRGRRGAARRRPARPGRRTGSPAASAGAARWRGCCSATTTWWCSTSPPTTSTSRRSPGWPAPGPSHRPRWWSSPTTAGSSTRSAPRPGRCTDGGRRRLRRRVRGVRAGQGRAATPGRGLGVAAAEPDAQGARLAAARPARPHVEAEVPHRRGQRADRGRAAAARPARAPAVRDPAARQGRRRPRGRRPGARRAARCSRTPPGGSAPATGSGSSASTAPGRPRCCGWSPASWRRRRAG